MLVLCTLNFRQNELNIAYKISLLITSTNLFLFSIPKTTHFHERDISFLFIYFFTFLWTCGNMYNLLFLICALKFMQIALLYLYHEKNTVECIFTQQSGFKSVYAVIHI